MQLQCIVVPASSAVGRLFLCGEGRPVSRAQTLLALMRSSSCSSDMLLVRSGGMQCAVGPAAAALV